MLKQWVDLNLKTVIFFVQPFDVRMHYGHPDVFDRLFHVTRGAVFY